MKEACPRCRSSYVAPDTSDDEQLEWACMHCGYRWQSLIPSLGGRETKVAIDQEPLR
jgi:transposase-like protein